jgi:hypothetical protein
VGLANTGLPEPKNTEAKNTNVEVLSEAKNTEAKKTPEDVANTGLPEAKNTEIKNTPEDVEGTDSPEVKNKETENSNSGQTAGVAVVRITSVFLTNSSASNETAISGGADAKSTAWQENALANNSNPDAKATNADLQLKDTTFVVKINETGQDKTSVQVAKIADVEKTYSFVDNATSEGSATENSTSDLSQAVSGDSEVNTTVGITSPTTEVENSTTSERANTTSKLRMIAHEENVALDLLNNLNLTRKLFNNADDFVIIANQFYRSVLRNRNLIYRLQEVIHNFL